jgi:hypothetical protein
VCTYNYIYIIFTAVLLLCFFQYVEIFKTLAVPHWGCMAIGHLAATGAPVPLTADADAAVPKVEVPRSSLRVLINLSTLYINMCIYIYYIDYCM